MVLAKNEGQVSQLQQILMQFLQEAGRGGQAPHYYTSSKDYTSSKEAKESKDRIPLPLPEDSAQALQNKPKTIEIFQNGQIVAQGIIEGEQFKLTQQSPSADHLAGQLSVLRSLSVGITIPGAENLKVEVQTEQGRQILLETDAEGQIIANIQDNRQKKSEMSVIQAELDQLNPKVANPLKQLFKTAEQQQQSQAELKVQIEALTQENQKLTEHLQLRSKQPKNPQWWEQEKQTGLRGWWQGRQRQKQAQQWAKTLITQWQKAEQFQRLNLNEEYETKGYVLSHLRWSAEAYEQNASIYQLQDKNNPDNSFKFKVDQKGKIHILEDQVSEQNIKDLQSLERQLNGQRVDYQDIQPFTLDSTIGIISEAVLKEKQREINTTGIIQDLKSRNQQQAYQFGDSDSIYRGNVSEKGDIKIWHQHRGEILIYSGENDKILLNNMNLEDLNIFAQSLSQPPQQQPTASRGGHKR